MKPETLPVTAFQTPHVFRSEAAREAAVFERTIEVEPPVVRGKFVSDPAPVIVYVRGLRMARHRVRLRSPHAVADHGAECIRGPRHRVHAHEFS